MKKNFVCRTVAAKIIGTSLYLFIIKSTCQSIRYTKFWYNLAALPYDYEKNKSIGIEKNEYWKYRV